jgi:hypothetical protein
MKAFTASSVETALGFVAVVVLAVPVLFFFGAIGTAPIFAEDHEDIELAIEYLSPRMRSSDVLYVHATMSEPFELYRHRLTSPPSGIIYGKIGSPCCPRHEYRDPRQESADDVSSEISMVSEAAAGRSLWLLSTDRELHWLHVGRNDVAIFSRALPGQGCRKGDEAKFLGIYIGRFDCAARSKQANR